MAWLGRTVIWGSSLGRVANYFFKHNSRTFPRHAFGRSMEYQANLFIPEKLINEHQSILRITTSQKLNSEDIFRTSLKQLFYRIPLGHFQDKIKLKDISTITRTGGQLIEGQKRRSLTFSTNFHDPFVRCCYIFGLHLFYCSIIFF